MTLGRCRPFFPAVLATALVAACGGSSHQGDETPAPSQAPPVSRPESPIFESGGGVAVSSQPAPAPDPTTGLVACGWPVSVTIPTFPISPRAYTSSSSHGATGPRRFAEDNGSAQYFRYEHFFVLWAESRGFDLVYVTNVDVDRDASLLAGQRLFLSVGHDEYWSRRERDAVRAALETGTSLAFSSGNSAYWQIRIEPSRADARPGRTQVCWKSRARNEDPLRGTPLTTTRWRDPPVSEPEAALLGVMYSG